MRRVRGRWGGGNICRQEAVSFVVEAFTTLMGNTADDRLLILFLFFPENRI